MAPPSLLCVLYVPTRLVYEGMNLTHEIQNLFPALHIRENQPLSNHTTFKLGGPCPLLIDNPDADQLPKIIRTLAKKGIPFLVIGQGSNLVISDAGLNCVVIRFCTDRPNIKTTENQITVSGDTLLDDLAQFTIEHNHGDLTYCSGIPGTIGGAIAGNAGAFGRQMGDHLISAEILGLDGNIRTSTQENLDFTYRHSALKKTGEIVLSATLQPPAGNKRTMHIERERIITFRKENHPDWRKTPCAGSIFRNIEASSAAQRRQAAGYYLEKIGAKTMHIGGAHIFEKHANMIIGDNTCTAQNVWDLSELLKQTVQKKFNIELIREVQFLKTNPPSPTAETN